MSKLNWLHKPLNNHQLKAGGLKIGGLNRRLKEKAAESRWFVLRAKRPSGGLKPPYGNQRAALQLTVTNGDQCSDGWMVTVDERAPEKRLGKEASIEVLPGIHTARINGQITGKPVQAEQAVKVGPGEIQKVELTLV